MSPAHRPLFIVNPVSGSGCGRSLAGEIRNRLAGQTVEASIVETLERGHAERLAATAAAEGYDRVVVVGGDGSIQEVLNGLLAAGAKDPPVLAIIPAGRGNDVARSLGLPQDPMACLAVALGAVSAPFDAGKASTQDGRFRHFAAAGGAGFDAQVAHTMALDRRFWMRGEAGYMLATLNELRRFRNCRLRLILDAEGGERVIAQNFLFVAFANCPYYGGGMQICPGARTGDGWLDVCMVGDLSRFAALLELPGIYKARHVNNPKIEIVRARSLRIEGEPQTRIHLDGEPFGELPLEVSLLAGAVRVAVPGT